MSRRTLQAVGGFLDPVDVAAAVTRAEEIRVRPALADLSVLYHEDLVGETRGCVAMKDEDDDGAGRVGERPGVGQA